MISLVTHMHERFIEMKQSQNNNSIPIPPDLCCQLSLELMTDPVIVSSGQTYEREYITNWINLGLTICPKTPAPVANHSSVVHYQSYQAPDVHQPSQASFPLMDSGLVVPSFLPSDDPIASLNKEMAFISTAFTSRYPPTKNQLRT
ncbi:U-box domain-containing protein 2-like protein isoform X1 [Tanacetum coccineum]